MSSWFVIATVVLVAFAGLGAWATYTAHADPGTTTERRTAASWVADGGFDHSATVVRENPLYPVGTTLSNRSTYFAAAAPVLDGRYTVRQRGLSGEATVSLVADLVIRSADDEETYWTDRERLNGTEATVVGPDEPATVAFSVNVSRVEERIAEIREGIGDTPGETSVAVVVDARIVGLLDGERSSLSFSRRLPLSLSGDTYAVTPPGDGPERVERMETADVPREHGPLRSVGGPFALAAGAVGLAGLAYGWREGRFELSAAERERLAHLDDREEFDEWIAAGRLDAAVADAPPAVEFDSLADLVNFAIDSDAGVVDDGSGTFHVLTGGRRFVYRASDPSSSEPPELATSVDAVTPGGEDDPTDDSADEPDGEPSPTASPSASTDADVDASKDV